jgi:hypothetical protein
MSENSLHFVLDFFEALFNLAEKAIHVESVAVRKIREEGGSGVTNKTAQPWSGFVEKRKPAVTLESIGPS